MARPHLYSVLADNSRVPARSLGMYLEEQEACFCLVHGMNAYLARRVTTGSKLLAFMRAYNRLQENVEWNSSGNFADIAFTEYMYCHNMGEPVMLVFVAVGTDYQSAGSEPGVSKELFLSHFPPNSTS